MSFGLFLGLLMEPAMQVLCNTSPAFLLLFFLFHNILWFSQFDLTWIMKIFINLNQISYDLIDSQKVLLQLFEKFICFSKITYILSSMSLRPVNPQPPTSQGIIHYTYMDHIACNYSQS